MPRGDGTGPAGMGPMSGRGVGYCGGFSAPGYANPVPGRMGPGLGRGFGGGGRGWRHQYYATGMPGWARYGAAPAWGAVPPVWGAGAAPTVEQEADLLRQQADLLKQQLDAISQRLDELEKES